MVVREVDADDNRVEPLGGRRGLREMVTANPGDWFNRTAIATSLMSITRRYRDDGFAHVDITPETDLNMDRRVVNVAIVIRRGPPVRIERINIRGNTKTRDSVIRREVTMIEGELYSQSNAETSRARIQALGYFERVEMSEEEGSAPDRIVINIEVAERATGTFQIGAGFSSIESFILTGQVQQQNLFGNGQNLSVQLQLSGIRQLVQIQFLEPYFFDTEWTFGFDLFKTVRQLSFFTRDSTGGSFTFGHPLGDYRLRLFAQYRADYVEIGAATAGIFGAAPTGQVQNLFPQLPLDNLFRAGLTSSLRLTLTWDGRNNRLFPTDGFYMSYSAELSDEFIGSAPNNTFIRHSLDTRVYYPIYEGVVFRARGRRAHHLAPPDRRADLRALLPRRHLQRARLPAEQPRPAPGHPTRSRSERDPLGARRADRRKRAVLLQRRARVPDHQRGRDPRGDLHRRRQRLEHQRPVLQRRSRDRRSERERPLQLQPARHPGELGLRRPLGQPPRAPALRVGSALRSTALAWRAGHRLPVHHRQLLLIHTLPSEQAQRPRR